VLQTKSGPLNRALSHVRRHFGIDFRRWVLPRNARKINGGKYSKIELDYETIERGAYKKYLGGAPKNRSHGGSFSFHCCALLECFPLRDCWTSDADPFAPVSILSRF
jgi:hypothetical protein